MQWEHSGECLSSSCGSGTGGEKGAGMMGWGMKRKEEKIDDVKK
jgi:hypothetical protein